MIGLDLLAMAPPSGASGQQGPAILSFLPMIFIVFLFYFLMIRPQQLRQKKTQQMQNSLKKNDKVITSGGIHGIVVGEKEHIVTVKIAAVATAPSQ